MKKCIVIICLVFAPTAFAANSIKATVNGMVCAFCAKGIEKKLKTLPEGKAVFVDLKSRVVVLELKEGATAPVDAFSAAITDAGYSISKVEAVEQSIADIKADIKGKQHD